MPTEPAFQNDAFQQNAFQVGDQQPQITQEFLRKCIFMTGRKQIGKKVILRYISGTAAEHSGQNARRPRQDIYPYVVPNNPQTPAQQANRNKFKDAMTAWSALSADEKAKWESKAYRRDLAGKNLFVKAFILDEL